MSEKQDQKDKLKLEKYLNENLAAYLRDASYNGHGVPRSKDDYGELYKTYSYLNYDSLVDYTAGRWQSMLNEAKRNIDKIIDSLILAKSHEKPEGGSTAVRKTEVHWRQFPKVTVNPEFLQTDCLNICFRLNIHHKE